MKTRTGDDQIDDKIDRIIKNGGNQLNSTNITRHARSIHSRLLKFAYRAHAFRVAILRCNPLQKAVRSVPCYLENDLKLL